MASFTKRIYALASELGISDSSSGTDDMLHQLVYSITGKLHITELTDAEASEVQNELMKRMRLRNRDRPLKKGGQKKTVPGMMSVPQQKKAWRLAYRLDEIDHTEASVAERLLGVIEKVLGITASKADPFRWINFDDGTKLIEQLKRYVRSAERKAKKGGSG